MCECAIKYCPVCGEAQTGEVTPHFDFPGPAPESNAGTGFEDFKKICPWSNCSPWCFALKNHYCTESNCAVFTGLEWVRMTGGE